MNILDKLKKLIAHEESAREIGNQAEAQAFAERIQQLLDKHNLSMSEVELHAAENSPIDLEPVSEIEADIEDWQTLLLNKIADLNGCHSLQYATRRFQVVIGRESDRAITISLYKYFEKLALDLLEKSKPVRDISIGFDPADMSIFSVLPLPLDGTLRTSFLLGFAGSVCKRLEEMHRKDTANAAQSAALVFLGSRQKDNREFMDQKLNVTKVEGAANKVDRSAYLRGLSAGDSIALTDKTLK